MTSKMVLLMVLLVIITSSSGQLLLNNVGGSDLTLVSGSSGVDVVDACIQKINSIPGIGSLLSNDFGFLKRLALVESNFGESAVNLNGGIWQISCTITNALTDNNNFTFINGLNNILLNGLPSSILDFGNSDFSVPLKSAVAARLYVEIILQSQAIPGAIDEQANWWRDNYNPNGVVADFMTTVSDYENINGCTVSKLDLWFLIDGSGSITTSNFQECLEFVTQTSALLQISPDNVRTGLMIYDGATYLRSYLSQHQSNSLFSSVVSSTPYPGGGTRTGAAIDRIAQEGFNISNGARPENEGVPRILVVLTDGKSQDDVTIPAINIQNTGVTVFGVGVGTGYDESEINEIASNPDSAYAYEISQFTSLPTVLRDRVSEQACTAAAQVPNNTEISVVVQAQTTVYFKVELPINGSVRLSYVVTVTTSIGLVYLSELITNPNSALNDASFTVGQGSTTVFYNAIGTSSSTDGMKSRAETNATISLYIAFKSKGMEPINMQFAAATSTTKATAGSSVLKGMAVPSIMFLALLSLLLSQ